jgi:hypothetical protein
MNVYFYTFVSSLGFDKYPMVVPLVMPLSIIQRKPVPVAHKSSRLILVQGILLLFIQLIAVNGRGAVFSSLTDTGICAGTSITLTSPRTGANQYTWSTTQTGASITVSPGATTIYWVEASYTSTGALYRDSFTVNVEAKAAAPAIKLDSTFITSTSCTNCKVKWYRNNTFLKITPDTLFFPLEGVYYAQLSLGSYCWSLPSPYIYVPNDRDTSSLTINTFIYPNPNTGYFNVDLVFPRMLSSVFKVTVVSTSGTVLYKAEPFLYRTGSSRIPIRLPAGFSGQAVVQLVLPGRVPITKQIIVQ